MPRTPRDRRPTRRADAAERNVATELADPGSVLATYRRLLGTRRRLRPLQVGSLRRVASGDRDVLAWIRATAGEEVLVAVNFTNRMIRTTLEADAGPGPWLPVAGSHPDPGPPIDADRIVTLRPFDAVIAEPQR
ncbi:MAG TPA: alpha-glucosidase C-terminal domain-containing protein [Candidatus Limnocylindrales bacterium]|nr:alpha-glucosidase C-terminal domain-containing protein [Candidatus Limnocylindrales bacterium]